MISGQCLLGSRTNWTEIRKRRNQLDNKLHADLCEFARHMLSANSVSFVKIQITKHEPVNVVGKHTAIFTRGNVRKASVS